MSLLRVALLSAKCVSSVAVIGFGLYGLGFENPIMNSMSCCGDWIFGALVLSGFVNIASVVWVNVLKKGECFSSKKCSK